ncbi:MAG TPA: ferritin-like domain-containing protein [Candidatus Acidoferrales bacterium]
MENGKKISEALQSPVDRRGFVKSVGLGAAGLASAAVVGGKLGILDKIPGINRTGLTARAVAAGAITDVDILNFALNLEYLEAEFYTVVTTGKTLAQSGFNLNGTGTPGPTTGGGIVSFLSSSGGVEVTKQLKAVMAEITYDEQQHVHLLRGALGADAIAKPAINLDALGTGYEGFMHCIAVARAFEDVGVSAYGGAAPLISSKDYLGVAAQIALTEAYHAGTLRLICAANNDAFLFKVDGRDILPPPNGTQYFPVDYQALARTRTTSEVLAIVYANSTSGATGGGFYPNGMNGNITTV